MGIVRSLMVPGLMTATLATFTVAAMAQDQKAELFFYAFCSRATDELDGDELYLQLNVDGGKTRRMPDKGSWYVEDDGATQRKVVKQIFAKQLKPGEVVKIVLVVMEEDDGGIPPAFIDGLTKASQEYANDKDSKTSPLIPILGNLIKLLTKNDDDVIGALAITLKNEGGKIVTTVEPAHGKVETEKILQGEFPIAPFRCSGDDSNYQVAIWEGGPRPSEPETHK